MPAQPAPAPVQRLPYHAPLGARLCDRCLFPQAMAAADPSADALEPLWPYLRSNPGLLVILTAKASGALTWGLAELIEVELSALSSFQLDGGCAHPSLPLCPALPRARVSVGWGVQGARSRRRSVWSTCAPGWVRCSGRSWRTAAAARAAAVRRRARSS